MANELLAKINEAERLFEEKTENAKEEAKKIISLSLAEDEKIIENAKCEAAEISSSIIAEAKKTAAEILKNEEAQTKMRVEALVKEASLHESAAVLAVTKKMLELA